MSITFTGHRHWIEGGERQSCAVFRSDEQHDGETDDDGVFTPNLTYVDGCTLRLANAAARQMLKLLGLDTRDVSDGELPIDTVIEAATRFIRYAASYSEAQFTTYPIARLYALALLCKSRGATHIHYS